MEMLRLSGTPPATVGVLVPYLVRTSGPGDPASFHCDTSKSARKWAAQLLQEGAEGVCVIYEGRIYGPREFGLLDIPATGTKSKQG
jgi:hypothetical protein